MKNLKVAGGKHTVIDGFNYEVLSKQKWCMVSKYVGRKYKGKTSYLHREITKAKKGEWVDHINGNRLDNRLINLRICNRQQNLRNRGRQANNKSGYKGVSWHSKDKMWRANISVDNKALHLGEFRDIEKAVRAYNTAALKYHGDFAYLNKL